MLRDKTFVPVCITGILLITFALAAAAQKKPAHSLSYYSVHYKKYNDLRSLVAIIAHIRKGWKLSQARALLGEGVDMGYGGYRYTARNTYTGLELRIAATADGRDTIITAKEILELRE